MIQQKPAVLLVLGEGHLLAMHAVIFSCILTVGYWHE